MNFECRLKDKMELDSNTLFIGEVLDVKVDESVLDGERGPDIKRIKPVVYWPSGDGSPRRITRLDLN